MTNLLNNAARYTEPGGKIALVARTERKDEVEQLLISVTDNGRGIAPELLRLVFGMFVQGEDKRNITGAGLGVGLALAKSIVELHQGSLEAKSEGLGKGSEFIIRLPLIQQPIDEEPLTTADDATASRFNILVVDDNRDAALMMGAPFRKQGHEVNTAFSGKEALELFDKHHPDLVLLDIGMPHMNGYELARQIRRHPYGVGAHLIAVTGWGKDEDKYRSKEAGIDLHLVKPVESQQLLALLRRPGLGNSLTTGIA